MMRRLLRFVVAAAAGILVACASVKLVGAYPEKDPGLAALERAISGIESGRRTTPIVSEHEADGSATVTFLAKRMGGRPPRILSDGTGWGEHLDGTFDFAVGKMARVGSTAWYSLQAKVSSKARIEYLIAYGATDYRLDPHNPRHVEAPRASELVMPGYVIPDDLAEPTSGAGSLAEATVESPALRANGHLVVYTPAGYRADGDYPVVVFHDSSTREIPRVLDSLIARHAIEPVVAVFVEPRFADNDQRAGIPLRTFLTVELPRWLESRYAVTRAPARRAVIGISYGAKDALDAALRSPDGFDRVGLLIPGRRVSDADVAAIATSRARRVTAAILAGEYDEPTSRPRATSAMRWWLRVTPSSTRKCRRVTTRGPG